MVVAPSSTGQSATQIAEDVDRTSGNRARRRAKRRNEQTIVAQGARGVRHRIGRTSPNVISPIAEVVFGRVAESTPANIDRPVAVARDALIFGRVLAGIRYGTQDEAIKIANDSAYGLDGGGPFGGYKQSGIGREFGPEGLASHDQLNPSVCRPESIPDSAPFGIAGKGRQYKRSCH
jgi:hypothetical protein